jgi:hypothetical protein
VNEFLYNPPSKLETVFIGGIPLRVGDRVRIQPRNRADALDIALTGRIAVIEGIETDVEGQTQLALVLEDDVGVEPPPGHRFSYTAEEVEPLAGE